MLTSTQRRWRYSGAMATIQIKHLPEETHRVLRTRAAAAGQSLQEYLRAALIEQAASPTLEELFERVNRREKVAVSMTEILDAVHDGRAGR